MSNPKFKAKVKIQVRIGGRMLSWNPGDMIDLDPETVHQYLHEEDYEKTTQTADGSPQKVNTKKKEKSVSGLRSPTSD